MFRTIEMITIMLIMHSSNWFGAGQGRYTGALIGSAQGTGSSPDAVVPVDVLSIQPAPSQWQPGDPTDNK